jgi:hypothetical protein
MNRRSIILSSSEAYKSSRKEDAGCPKGNNQWLAVSSPCLIKNVEMVTTVDGAAHHPKSSRQQCQQWTKDQKVYRERQSVPSGSNLPDTNRMKEEYSDYDELYGE